MIGSAWLGVVRGAWVETCPVCGRDRVQVAVTYRRRTLRAQPGKEVSHRGLERAEAVIAHHVGHEPCGPLVHGTLTFAGVQFKLEI